MEEPIMSIFILLVLGRYILTDIFLHDILQFQTHNFGNIFDIPHQLYTPTSALIPRLHYPDVFHSVEMILRPEFRHLHERHLGSRVEHIQRPIFRFQILLVLMDGTVEMREELVPFVIPDLRKVPIDIHMLPAGDVFVYAIHGELQRGERYLPVYALDSVFVFGFHFVDEILQHPDASRQTEIFHEIVEVIGKSQDVTSREMYLRETMRERNSLAKYGMCLGIIFEITCATPGSKCQYICCNNRHNPSLEVNNDLPNLFISLFCVTR